MSDPIVTTAGKQHLKQVAGQCHSDETRGSHTPHSVRGLSPHTGPDPGPSTPCPWKYKIEMVSSGFQEVYRLIDRTKLVTEISDIIDSLLLRF